MFKKTAISEVAGAYVFDVERFHDDRGYFQPTYIRNKYFDIIPSISQTQISCSKKHVVRGLHVSPYSKLCTCVSGRLFDVVADVRVGSTTFGKWFGVWLDPENQKQLFIPSGCAHGFFASEDDTILMYQQDGLWNPMFEKEINWRDPMLNISWPESEDYILSEKDKNANFLAI